MGPLHDYGIARRIEQLSQDQVFLNKEERSNWQRLAAVIGRVLAAGEGQ